MALFVAIEFLQYAYCIRFLISRLGEESAGFVQYQWIAHAQVDYGSTYRHGGMPILQVCSEAALGIDSGRF
jgi:hypothetical protein